MRRQPYSPYDLLMALRGTTEIAGAQANPLIMAMLTLDAQWPDDDSVPWCSAALNFIAKLMKLPRSKSLLARSWLAVGEPVTLEDAEPGFDVVILKRGKGQQPGPEDLTAPGHVGLFAGWEGHSVLVLGGNQDDTISIAHFPTIRVLGIRRLA